MCGRKAGIACASRVSSARATESGGTRIALPRLGASCAGRHRRHRHRTGRRIACVTHRPRHGLRGRDDHSTPCVRDRRCQHRFAPRRLDRLDRRSLHSGRSAVLADGDPDRQCRDARRGDATRCPRATAAAVHRLLSDRAVCGIRHGVWHRHHGDDGADPAPRLKADRAAR
jgi:hypothetical protein